MTSRARNGWCVGRSPRERPFQLNDVTVSVPTAVTPAYRLVSHCTQVSSQGLYEPIIPLVSRD